MAKKHGKNFRTSSSKKSGKRKKLHVVPGLEIPPQPESQKQVPANQNTFTDRLRNWQSVVIIIIIGFVVYAIGLKNQFVGDDTQQIVSNPVVHSIAHVRILFEGGGFYNGNGIAALAGQYYRPLMLTVFSIIYTLFGANTFPYHLIQLFLCLGSTILLYFCFRYSFKPLLALILSLVFLVHPVDSQSVFAIASMEDALYFFFGILAVWLLFRFNSVRSLTLVCMCLFLALFAKESAVLFVIIALLYLFWFDRRRLVPFVGIVVLPVIVYAVLRYGAIGLSSKSATAPIDSVGLLGRLLNLPSIILFYIEKIVFPWRLANSYYWVHPHFSLLHTVVPFFIDFIIVSLVVYAGVRVKEEGTRAQLYSYIFFGIWTLIGILPYLQLVPLDMTACDTWIYFSMAGALGMLGIIVTTNVIHISPQWMLRGGVVLVLVLGGRTIISGRDWSNDYTLAAANIKASSDNYVSYNILAGKYLQEGDLSRAKSYTLKSIRIYPTYSNYTTYGTILATEGSYAGAASAYYKGLKYGDSYQIYDDLGEVALVGASKTAAVSYLQYTLKSHPKDYLLWMYLAIALDRNGDRTDAHTAIVNANNLGPIPQEVYAKIISDESFSLSLESIHKTVSVP